MPLIPDDLREAVLDDWAAGLRRAEIAERQGCRQKTVESVIERARRHNDPRAVRRNRIGCVAQHTIQRDEEIVASYWAGLSLDAISANVGCTKENVRDRLKRARDRGDLRAMPRRAPELVDDEEGEEADNDAILAALAAERRPRGTPRRYLDIVEARPAPATLLVRLPQDRAPMLLGDPPPGRSALCQRQNANT